MFTSLAFESSDVGHKQVTKCPTVSVWFLKFMIGLGSRMGETRKPNLALTTCSIMEVLDTIRKDLLETNDRKERFTLIVFASCIVYSYVLSLRGSEGLMLNLTSTMKGMDNQGKCLIIGLRGKVKGESMERDHLFPCVNTTSS